MNKQTVFIQDSSGDYILEGKSEYTSAIIVQKLESVYVLTEQEMNNAKREAAEKAWDACLESIHNNPTDDVEVSKQNYLNTNYPLC